MNKFKLVLIKKKILLLEGNQWVKERKRQIVGDLAVIATSAEADPCEVRGQLPSLKFRKKKKLLIVLRKNFNLPSLKIINVPPKKFNCCPLEATGRVVESLGSQTWVVAALESCDVHVHRA